MTFDSHAGGITVEHIMASTAFPIAFPPVRIEGRVYVDPGVSANLPIAPLFAEEGEDEVLCLAIDLVPSTGKVPQSMDEALGRTQDLVFASQSRHALRRLQDSAPSDARGKAVILHVSYSGDGQEIGGKFFEFSRGSIDHRWTAGQRDVSAALLAASMLPLTQGRTIYRMTGDELIAIDP
nr:patatin [Rhizobium sp. Khangiran2]